MLTKEEGGRPRPVTTYMNLHMFSKTWDSPTKVHLPDKEMVMPGEDARSVM